MIDASLICNFPISPTDTRFQGGPSGPLFIKAVSGKVQRAPLAPYVYEYEQEFDTVGTINLSSPEKRNRSCILTCPASSVEGSAPYGAAFFLAFVPGFVDLNSLPSFAIRFSGSSPSFEEFLKAPLIFAAVL